MKASIYWGVTALAAAVIVGSSVVAAPPKTDAEVQRGRALIRRAIEHHGQDRLKQAAVGFQFRGTRYRMTREDGQFRYERWTQGRRAAIHEVLGNDGFSVTVDGRARELAAPVKGARERSLNSVVYFASLPYVLEDPAVRPRARPGADIDGRQYETIEVRFAREGGGVDHDDEFRYWFDAKTGRLDYLAYRFHTNQGGVRFRVATGHPRVGGVVFVQWDNFGVDDKSIPLDSLPGLWKQGKLPKLSSIALDGLRVEAVP